MVEVKRFILLEINSNAVTVYGIARDLRNPDPDNYRTGFITSSPIPGMEGQNSCIHVDYVNPEYRVGGHTFDLSLHGVDEISEDEWEMFSFRKGFRPRLFFHDGDYFAVGICQCNQYVVLHVKYDYTEQGWSVRRAYYVDEPSQVSRDSSLVGYRYSIDCDQRFYGDFFRTQPPITEGMAYVIASQVPDIEPALSREFYSLCAELKLDQNSLANMAELAELVATLTNRRKALNKALGALKRSVGENAKDAWLKYRYAYLTSESDFSDLQEKIGQVVDHYDRVLRGTVESQGVTAHLTLWTKPYGNKMLGELLSFYSLPKELGLDLSLYNIWDMIPFSFVADWFLPIGQNLEHISNMSWASTMPYQVNALCSRKCIVSMSSEVAYRVYTRSYYSPRVDMHWYSPDGATLSTWTKRGLDLIALKK